MQFDCDGEMREAVFSNNGNKKTTNKQNINDPNLIEELEDMFQSAHDYFVS